MCGQQKRRLTEDGDIWSAPCAEEVSSSSYGADVIFLIDSRLEKQCVSRGKEVMREREKGWGGLGLVRVVAEVRGERLMLPDGLVDKA